MTEPTPATTRGNYFCAAVAAAFGVFIILLGLGVVPITGRHSSTIEPQWLALCIGLAFFLAAVAVVIQTRGHANAAGELPTEAPRWMRTAQYLIGLTIFVCFGAISSWVAFGPGERHFSGSFLFFDRATNAAIGRTAFGIGAVLIWLCIAAILASGFRRFFDDHGRPTAG